jgi:DNA-directed RNA polymerase subunit L
LIGDEKKFKKIDRKTRRTLTMYKMHHPKADKDRLYIKRKEGGRCLSQTEAAYKRELISQNILTKGIKKTSS